MDGTVNIELLKNFAKKDMKDYPITQGYILVEPEHIPIEVFISKFELWLRSLKMETELKS